MTFLCVLRKLKNYIYKDHGDSYSWQK